MKNYKKEFSKDMERLIKDDGDFKGAKNSSKFKDSFRKSINEKILEESLIKNTERSLEEDLTLNKLIRIALMEDS